MRISDWSSDVCSSDLDPQEMDVGAAPHALPAGLGFRAGLEAAAVADADRADEDPVPVRPALRHLGHAGEIDLHVQAAGVADPRMRDGSQIIRAGGRRTGGDLLEIDAMGKKARAPRVRTEGD